jgi:AraC family transcriptional regulator
MNASHREYIYRINRVIDYIDNHLTEDLTVAELASVANFSPYHFHRIFSAFVGEPLYAFIKRLKVEKAASMLINFPEKPVNEIAWDCGYKSDSVFCRTFKEHFGMNTADFRKCKTDEIRKIRQSLSKNGKPGATGDGYVCSVETIKNISQMKNIRIQQQPAMQLVYTRHTGAFDQIGKAYGKLMQWAGPRGLIHPGVKTVTIYHDDPTVTEIEKLRQSACITVDQEVKTEGEFGNISLPEGKYVVGSFEIGPEGFTDAWNQVCLWLAESGYQPADGQPYELYHNNHEEHPEKKFIVDICIPVKPM